MFTKIINIYELKLQIPEVSVSSLSGLHTDEVRLAFCDLKWQINARLECDIPDRDLRNNNVYRRHGRGCRCNVCARYRRRCRRCWAWDCRDCRYCWRVGHCAHCWQEMEGVDGGVGRLALLQVVLAVAWKWRISRLQRDDMIISHNRYRFKFDFWFRHLLVYYLSLVWSRWSKQGCQTGLQSWGIQRCRWRLWGTGGIHLVP